MVRRIYITEVITRRLRLKTSPIVTTFLRSIIRSAPCAVRCVHRHFKRRITFLISIIAGGGSAGCIRSGRVSGFHRVLTSVRCSIQTLLVGLTSHLRGVHALDDVGPSGRVGVTNRASCFCTPLTGHLKLCRIGSRLRGLSFRCHYPESCSLLRGLLRRRFRTSHDRVRTFATGVRNLLTGRNVRTHARIHCHGPCDV